MEKRTTSRGFIKVTDFDAIIGKDNKIEKWCEERLVQIQILPSVKIFFDFLGQMQVKSILDVEESNSPIKMGGNKMQNPFQSPPKKLVAEEINIGEKNDDLAKNFEMEEMKQESENDKQETETSGGKDMEIIEVQYNSSVIPDMKFLGRFFYLNFTQKFRSSKHLPLFQNYLERSMLIKRRFH